MIINGDAELIQAYLDGDENAFHQLYHLYEKPLYSYILRYVGNRDTAQDVFQKIWMKVIKAAGNYDERGKFGSWLFGIAHNCCIDQVRKKRMIQAEDEEGHSLFDRIPSDAITPDNALIQSEEREYLEAAIGQLPDEQREVLLLRVYSDISFREIARITDCPLNTVLGRMHYAVKNLKRIINSMIKEAT